MESLLKNATEILLLIFLIITFLQSGIDKVFDWTGNLNWLKDHFSDTPLRNLVPVLLGTVLLVEVSAGILCAIGLYQLLIIGESTMALYGAILSCVALLMLLFGQRMAKDYEGAKTIAVYFVPAIFLVFLLQS
ncbi:DoxX family membrane protein [Poritiphilus flavus]|uniref:DoxX family membrane protein n=1 Tax=Poritiphilus flavus TaxID=2697053 RepID=A0A6L9E8A9_9FLAO|nr:DoxX family membrane protein [Poritiphilus flavus]NAS10995.1 DoxX family membrane protein [Poritiphilus flavus]